MTNVVHLLPAFLAGVVFALVLVAGGGRQGGGGGPPVAGGGGGAARAAAVDADVTVERRSRIEALENDQHPLKTLQNCFLRKFRTFINSDALVHKSLRVSTPLVGSPVRIRN